MKYNCLFRYFLLTVLFAAVLITGCQQGKQASVDADKLREYAGDLINKGLYKQAIQEYSRYLDEYNIDSRERANVNYIIASTYFERLKEYDNALAYYLKIKHLYAENSLMPEVNKKIYACLERTGRSEDAQQVLDESVQLDPSKVRKKRPGAIVARIGNQEITQGDLDFELSQLPPSLREQLNVRDKKLEFLREYVATELLYNTAKRSGFENDPEVIESAFQAKKSLMVRKLLQDRVAGKVDITESDIELYYQANKDDFAQKDNEGNIIAEKPLSEVKQQVAQALTQERYQKAYNNLVEKMIRAEDVTFFESRVK